MLHLIDGQNYVRRMLEHDPSGRVPRKILITMQTIATEPVVWCWEGKGAWQTRRAIYPPYKGRRDPQPDSTWQTINLIRDMLQHTHAMQVSAPGFEADDLIAFYTRSHADKMQVHIHSNDRDFNQLRDQENVTGDFEEIANASTSLVRTYKTCVGDHSDNVSGIKGFGEKTWVMLRDIGALHALRHMLEALPTTHPSHTSVFTQLPVRCQGWINEHLEELFQMWLVVGFFDVANVHKDFTIGQPDYDKADLVLREFLQ